MEKKYYYLTYVGMVNDLCRKIIGTITDKVKALGGTFNTADKTEDNKYDGYDYCYSNNDIGGNGRDGDTFYLKTLTIKDNELYCTFHCDFENYFVETEIADLSVDALLNVLDTIEDFERFGK